MIKENLGGWESCWRKPAGLQMTQGIEPSVFRMGVEHPETLSCLILHTQRWFSCCLLGIALTCDSHLYPRTHTHTPAHSERYIYKVTSSIATQTHTNTISQNSNDQLSTESHNAYRLERETHSYFTSPTMCWSSVVYNTYKGSRDCLSLKASYKI